MAQACFLGMDFGTESVRAVVVDRSGRERGSAIGVYPHGQIVPESEAAKQFFSDRLPDQFALQHPEDWITGAAVAVRGAAADLDLAHIAGIGVDFTSCTMLPCSHDATPLAAKHAHLANNPHAWPKLWKHHGAVRETQIINRIARERNERWLSRYGGIIGLEWFFPKILEVIENAPDIADATDIWIEAGDWFVWRLVGGPPESIPRSTCQAGYKACWSKENGYPSREFLSQCHPKLADVVEKKLAGRMIAPGARAGTLCEVMAGRLGLPGKIPVSAAIIDAHAGVPGAGVAENGVLVMVLGTSGCHMLLSDRQKMVRGVAGIVEDGILPGHVGYETGQPAMGDAFDWVRRLAGSDDFESLTDEARRIPPGADGILCLDWFNGCRTPLMDGSLTGAFAGLTLHHTAGHLYRSVLEASAFGLRWIVDTLREGGVPVERFIATGGLPHRNSLFMEIVASALGAPIEIHGSRHGPALGAAILGACAAGAFDSPQEAVAHMAGARSAQPASRMIDPLPAAADVYDRVYARYRKFADVMASRNSPIRAG